jgi:hypothetical protein
LGVAYHQGYSEDKDWEGYEDRKNVPKNLARIELAGFKCALDVLLQHPAASGHVGIIGGSRGGELALILGALYGNDANSERCAGLRAIVSMVPYACVGPAHSWDEETRKQFRKTYEPAWMFQGEVYVGKGNGADINSSTLQYRIPSEDISPPLFVVSGGQDKVWCDDEMPPISSMPDLFDASCIVQHGGRRNSDDVAIHFPDAGHFFLPPFALETVQDDFLLKGGGVSAEASRDAARRAHVALEQFLEKHLPRGPVAAE